MYKNIIITFFSIVFIVAAIALFVDSNSALPVSTEVNPTPSSKVSMVPYSNIEYGISFEYPSNLYLSEKEMSSSSPEFSIALVENSSTVEESPVSIFVDVYMNTKNLNAKDWISNETNWTVPGQTMKDVEANGLTGVIYTYDGLYPGKAYVFTAKGRAYVLSVNWLNVNDQLIKDFDMIINSLEV
jgi:hypothetical protein